MDNVIVKKIRYFETRRGFGYEVSTNQGTIWNDGRGGGTYTDVWDWTGRNYNEWDLEKIIDKHEKVDSFA